MPDQHTPTASTFSAVIIPFPARPAPDPQDRLRRALAGLDAALEEQRQAVAAWRGALGELQTGVGALDGSLRQFQGRLAGLHGAVDELHAGAVRLQRWADTALRRGAG